MPFLGSHRHHHHFWKRDRLAHHESSAAALMAAGIAQFIVTLDYWSAAIALPKMAIDLQTPVATVQWAITVYTLTFCMMSSVCGKLGDRYGRKRLLLLGMGGSAWPRWAPGSQRPSHPSSSHDRFKGCLAA